MTTVEPQHTRPGAPTRAWRAFRRWRRSRPFWGGLLLLLAGVEIFETTQRSIGDLEVHFGPTGFLSWLIPAILVACGLLLWVTPQQRLFYSIVGSLTAVYSLIAVNFGGFFLGMLLGMVGAALGFAWTPRRLPAPVEPVPAPDLEYDDEPEDAEDLVPFPGADPRPADDRSEPADAGLDLGHGRHGYDHQPADLLTDTLPQPRNPLREQPPQPDGPGGSGYPADPGRIRGVPRETGGPGPGSAGERGGPGAGLLAALLLAGSLAATGLAVPLRAAPAAAAPCPSVPGPTASAGTSGEPAPTAQPGTPSPAPAPPSPSPSATPSQGSGNILTGIVDGVRKVFGISSDQPADPTPAPSATRSAAPAAKPAAAAPEAPAPSGGPASGTPTPTGSPSCDPKPGSSADPGKGKIPQLAPDPGAPVGADQPSRLTGSKLTMTGLKYEGIIKDFRTAHGTVPVLKFSMDKAVTDDFLLRIPGQPPALRYASDKLTVDGHVVFYTTRFVARFLGIKLTLTPDSPLPPDGIPIPLPFGITMTDPDIQLALVTSDKLIADPLVNNLG
ncbi:DUF6114 domain-containing protein [Plantactinospora siamensis]|uniref:DUF6114 domain-containing protein n=1 Tax=Plantactinospora siamensis TaxID=555372 RepID=A0ABV6P5B9_9ACTN